MVKKYVKKTMSYRKSGHLVFTHMSKLFAYSQEFLDICNHVYTSRYAYLNPCSYGELY